MSTHSTIAMEAKNGKVHSIYCHYDGYFSHQIPILTRYYSHKEMVEKLIESGNRNTLDLPENLSVSFYKDYELAVYNTFDDFEWDKDSQQEYVYYFNGQWYAKCKTDPHPRWKLASEIKW